MVHRKFSSREITLGAGFLILLVIIVTFYILYQTESVQIGYKIAEKTNKVSLVNEEIKKFEAKKAALLSLQRVETIARDTLGLTDPAPGQVFYEGRKFPAEKKGS